MIIQIHSHDNKQTVTSKSPMVYLPRQALPLVVKDMWDTNRHTLAMTLRLIVDLRSPL